MEEYRNTIVQKYRKIARLPDFLFGFTFPLRKKSIEKLHLTAGSSVLEVGCSSGANFAYLVRAVGESGKIVGVDLSPDMVAEARRRVQKRGWENITVIEAAAEEVVLPDLYDGLLLFAMHDVLVSPKGLDNILAYLKPGGRVVTAGPKLAGDYPGRVLNPLIRQVFKRFAVSTQDMDRPWRLLAGRTGELEVEEFGPGLMYLAHGVVG